MLTKLKYVIFHDGTNGIKSVKAQIEMTNLSPILNKANDSIVVSQTFGYEHFWSTDNVTAKLDYRSGNPGYLVGKPILAGVLAHKDPKMIKTEDEIDAITPSELFIDRGIEDITQFLTIMTSSDSCHDAKRYNIENLIIISDSCKVA